MYFRALRGSRCPFPIYFSTGRSSAVASKPRYIGQNCVFERADIPEQPKQRFRAPSCQSGVNNNVVRARRRANLSHLHQSAAENLLSNMYNCIYSVVKLPFLELLRKIGPRQGRRHGDGVAGRRRLRGTPPGVHHKGELAS
jgi:hypothetical protein